MTGTIHEFPVGRMVAEPETEAPALPIEQHIVSAALTAERLRGLSEHMVLILRYASRDQAMFDRLHGEMIDAWASLSDHYAAYRAVLECKGQA